MAVKQVRRVDPGRTLRRRRFMALALGLFLILDIGLVAVALNTGRAPSGAAAEAPVPTVEVDAAPEVTPEPTTAAPAVLAVAPTRLLVALDDSIAWRATTGTCPETPALPERTTDAGGTWVATDATAPTDMRSIRRIIVEGRDLASFVGQSPVDCAAMFVRTFVGGTNYEEFAEGLGGAWHVNPLNGAEVRSPAGDFAAPCATVLALAARDAAGAAVLCADGTIHRTADAATTWSAPVQIAGALNIAASSDGYTVAVVGDEACAGVRLVGLSEAAAAAPLGCLPSAQTPEALAGNVAVSVTDDTIWLWAGDALVRSGDGGETWL
ncbi:hypothetical protein ABIB15_002448 [Marisediminicola sp. UYEF4]|uniref:hypothetical protein n=1 Tax=Marisediminicola sp. UYEF4 TaxID=1756384 RepID=UPI0033991778